MREAHKLSRWDASGPLPSLAEVLQVGSNRLSPVSHANTMLIEARGRQNGIPGPHCRPCRLRSAYRENANRVAARLPQNFSRKIVPRAGARVGDMDDAAGVSVNQLQRGSRQVHRERRGAYLVGNNRQFRTGFRRSQDLFREAYSKGPEQPRSSPNAPFPRVFLHGCFTCRLGSSVGIQGTDGVARLIWTVSIPVKNIIGAHIKEPGSCFRRGTRDVFRTGGVHCKSLFRILFASVHIAVGRR